MRDYRGNHHRLRLHREERHYALGTGATIALYIAAAAAIAGAAVSTVSAVQQADQNEKLAKATAKQKEIEAETATQTANFEEQQHRRRVRLLMGQQEATYAASGMDPSQGTPIIREIDLVKQGELESLAIKRGGRIEAASSRFESNIAKFQAGVYAGRQPLTIASGVFGAAASGASAYYGGMGKTQTRKPTVQSDMV